MHFLKSYKFWTHCAVCDIKMNGYGIEFAVCRLHSENAKRITADDVLYTKKLNMRQRIKCHHCHFYLPARLTQVAAALALSEDRPKFPTLRVSLQTLSQ